MPCTGSSALFGISVNLKKKKNKTQSQSNKLLSEISTVSLLNVTVVSTVYD